MWIPIELVQASMAERQLSAAALRLERMRRAPGFETAPHGDRWRRLTTLALAVIGR